ncbi:MAG: glucose-6-phosphate isomerase [bacterium]|nr:glucose-6-phosphate isomerase [bacterium]
MNKSDHPLRINIRFAISPNPLQENGITLPIINSYYHSKAQSAYDKAIKLREIGEIAWADLPYDSGISDLCIEYAKQIRNQFYHFVQVGIGGSALGAQAILEALVNEVQDTNLGLTYEILDNIDPYEMKKLLQRYDLNKTVFHIVTKSGSTPETMAQLFILFEFMKQKVGDQWRNHFYITTDPREGDLKKWAVEEQLPTMHIPPKVGGRFSVLTSVGLLAASVFQLNVYKLLNGAKWIEKFCWDSNIEKNVALKLAVLLHRFQKEIGIQQFVMMAYSNRLYRLCDWFRQLWAESLGKRFDENGNEIYTGSTPIQALGATDQHSQVQLYIEGPKDKLILFLSSPFEVDLLIPKSPFQFETSLKYLEKHYLGELLLTEMLATQIAFLEAGRPTLHIELNGHTPEAIGAFFYLWEMVTMFAGFLNHINPFDQPGVEAGKKNTAAMLGKVGMDEYHQKVKTLLELNPPLYIDE